MVILFWQYFQNPWSLYSLTCLPSYDSVSYAGSQQAVIFGGIGIRAMTLESNSTLYTFIRNNQFNVFGDSTDTFRTAISVFQQPAEIWNIGGWLRFRESFVYLCDPSVC